MLVLSLKLLQTDGYLVTTGVAIEAMNDAMILPLKLGRDFKMRMKVTEL